MKEQALILREEAKNQLLQIKTVDEAVTYINKVKAIETYCKAVKEDNEIVKLVAEQKIRSMRLAGAMLHDSNIYESTKNNLNNVGVTDNYPDKPTLSDLGLTKNESSTYQKLASIPNDEFEEEMERAKDGDSTKDITVSRFKNLKNENNFSERINDEKNIKRLAKKLGFKIELLKPDLLIIYKSKKDITEIKELFN